MTINHRQFITNYAVTGAALTRPLISRRLLAGGKPLFKIPLAQWSLHKDFFEGVYDPLDFARIARGKFGIKAIEYEGETLAGEEGILKTRQLLERVRDQLEQAAT